MHKNYHCDILLVGAGIMSATLASILQITRPELKIVVLESLPSAGLESSNTMSNAGTGHSGKCEVNYTSDVDGKIDISRAVKVAEEFELSKQFWSYMVAHGHIKNTFIKQMPHMTVVTSDEDIDFLRRRHAELKKVSLFSDLEFSEDNSKDSIINTWAPLVMEGRTGNVAATFSPSGTDVDFGLLTRELMNFLEKNNVDVEYNTKVVDIEKSSAGGWVVKAEHQHSVDKIHADFVFIGAGGLALTLLQKAHVKESKHYGGFPIGGEWLICDNPEVVNQHQVKAYGKAAIGAPPMSVEHLDKRHVDGKEVLLYGPFASFTTKFLKTGSKWDLLRSITPGNIWVLITAALKNFTLTKYLISQISLGEDEKFKSLLRFYPTAARADWKLGMAGKRVQIIKQGKDGKGVIEFGTEVIMNQESGIAAVAGASPGASTAVSVVMEIVDKMFATEDSRAAINQILPSYNKKLSQDDELLALVRENSIKNLRIY